MRLRGYIVCALAIDILALPAHAADKTLEMEPTTKWVLDYDRTSCKLARRFSSGDDVISAQFIAYNVGPGFELRLLGKPLQMSRSREIGLAFGSEFPARRVATEVGQIGEDKLPLLFMGVHRLLPVSQGVVAEMSPEQEALVETVTVTMPGGKAYLLKTGSMAEPMEAMRTCLDDLVRSWGLEPASLKRIVTPAEPIGSPGKWIRSSDYPSSQLNDGTSSNVSFMLIVGENGKVEDCYVQSVTDDSVFGDIVCEKVRERARFQPAKDNAGRSVRSLYRNSVRWRTGF